MNKKISIIGIGMDGAETITAAGKRAVEASDVLIGARRMIEPFDNLAKPFFLSYVSSEIADYIHACHYKNIAVLTSGDCGFYSAAEKLLPLLDDCETEIICGISSPVYFCSKLKISWSDVHFVSLHGTDANIVRNVCAHPKTFFLLGGNISPSDVCRRLCEYGMNGITIHIGENLSCKNERILSGAAEEFTNTQTDKLCVMIVENPDYERHLKSCIADDEFIRGKVPMTKSEVRSLCVSKLEIGKKDVCWDIGSGTGSVSVEMAIRCTDGKVFAVEKNPEATVLIDKNLHKFKCDNIEVTHDDARHAIIELPSPDCVFIGGSNGCLAEIIHTAYVKNSCVKIVITAVSLETLSECVKVFEENDFEAEITQIAVTRTRKIGSHTMLSAENPIFILKRKFI